MTYLLSESSSRDDFSSLSSAVTRDSSSSVQVVDNCFIDRLRRRLLDLILGPADRSRTCRRSSEQRRFGTQGRRRGAARGSGLGEESLRRRVLELAAFLLDGGRAKGGHESGGGSFRRRRFGIDILVASCPVSFDCNRLAAREISHATHSLGTGYCHFMLNVVSASCTCEEDRLALLLVVRTVVGLCEQLLRRRVFEFGSLLFDGGSPERGVRIEVRNLGLGAEGRVRARVVRRRCRLV